MQMFHLTWLTASAGQQAQQGNIVSLLLPFVLLFVIFYFMLIRPQQKQQKQRQQMLGSLKKGNKVITAGGLIGEITELKDDTIMVRIADKVEVKMTRSAVSQVLS